MPRGIKLELRGYLKYNQSTKKSTASMLLPAALRWGATTYNARFDDLGPTQLVLL